MASGAHNAKVPHDDRCRDRIGELMAEEDDQRQVERVSGAAEVEIPRPGAGEEMDVGEPMVRADGPPEDPPVPTVRVGGSSSSGTRAGSGSRANEANTEIVKRNVSDPEEARRRCGRNGSEGCQTTS